MTDKMAASIAADPRVQQAAGEQGSLRVVVEPVQNEMEAEILPRGQAEAFIARVRYLLSKHNPSSFTWIMNRDDFYELRKRELDVPLARPPRRSTPAMPWWHGFVLWPTKIRGGGPILIFASMNSATSRPVQSCGPINTK